MAFDQRDYFRMYLKRLNRIDGINIANERAVRDASPMLYDEIGSKYGRLPWSDILRDLDIRPVPV